MSGIIDVWTQYIGPTPPGVNPQGENVFRNYGMLDVFHNGKKVTQLAPERRFYNASQQTSTIVAIHSTLARDLYVVFEGRNPETDKPIIKVFLNPLVNWIWVGIFIVIIGTGIALTPPLVPVARRSEVLVAEVVHA